MPVIPRPKPSLMVIGDSLAQGCRSLTVNKTFSSQCYASLIAKSQKWDDFQTPDFPRSVVLDLEEEVRRLQLLRLIGAGGRLNRNLQGWLDDFSKSGGIGAHTCFDNLAIAGVSISEFESFKPGPLRKKLLKELPGVISQGLIDKFSKIGELHLAINAAFTLNPSKKAAYDQWDQLEWVRRRKPQRLFFHCGHNDGFYTVGSEAKEVNLRTKTWPKYRDLLAKLDKLPKEIGSIAVILFPKVSAVANLEPVGSVGEDGYARSYETRFPLPGRLISGKVLKKIDEDTKWMNRMIIEKVRAFDSESRFRIIDTYQILKKYDFKNLGGASRQLRIGKKVIDNRYLDGRKQRKRIKVGGRMRTRHSYHYDHGGLQSLDGMHPSAVGYAMFACEIMNKLDLLYDKQEIMKDALKAEGLISKYSRGHFELNSLLSIVEAFVPDENDQELTAGSCIGACGEPFS